MRSWRRPQLSLSIHRAQCTVRSSVRVRSLQKAFPQKVGRIALILNPGGLASDRSSDVCKRHMDRCARGLHTRKRRRQAVPKDTPVATPTQRSTDEAVPVSMEDLPPLDTDFDFDIAHLSGPEFQPAAPSAQTILEAHCEAEATASQPGSAPSVRLQSLLSTTPPPDALNLTPWAAAPHVASFFSQFHPFFPIVHKPSFSVSDSPRPLLSIIVAIGMFYSARSTSSHNDIAVRGPSQKLWATGVQQLEHIVGYIGVSSASRCSPPHTGSERLQQIPGTLASPSMAAAHRLRKLLRR